MKTYEIKKNIFEIITPFDPEAEDTPDDGFYDDCPICQKLKADLKVGKVKEVDLFYEKEK